MLTHLKTRIILYLRGIQFSELESIIQFIYLGEAKFYGERMDEFLAVAKSLEIKELCIAVAQLIVKPEDYPSQDDQEKSTKLEEEQTVISDHMSMQAPQMRQGCDVTGKYECDQCKRTYSGRQGLLNHKQTVHQGIKYACDQCDHQFPTQSNLTVHIHIFQ